MTLTLNVDLYHVALAVLAPVVSAGATALLASQSPLSVPALQHAGVTALLVLIAVVKAAADKASAGAPAAAPAAPPAVKP